MALPDCIGPFVDCGPCGKVAEHGDAMSGKYSAVIQDAITEVAATTTGILVRNSFGTYDILNRDGYVCALYAILRRQGLNPVDGGDGYSEVNVLGPGDTLSSQYKLFTSTMKTRVKNTAEDCVVCPQRPDSGAFGAVAPAPPGAPAPQANEVRPAGPPPAPAPGTPNPQPGTPNPPPSPPRLDYFPLVRGSTWTYATNLQQDDMVFDVVNTERIIDQDHVVLALSMVKTVGGRKKETPVQKEWFRRTPSGDVICPKRQVGSQEVQIDPPQIHLWGDLAPGATWNWQGRLEHGAAKASYAVEAEETVRVPAGEFKTLRIRIETTVEQRTGRVTRWLSPGVGMVKEEVEIDLGARDPAKVRAELKSYRIGPPAE